MTVLDTTAVPGGARPPVAASQAEGGEGAKSVGLLLVVVIAAQALMSLRLAWSNTAYVDEATYLAAGHAELAHWLHGTPAPSLAAFFSGAPVLYPPLGAFAASIGGLAGARLLSMLFMLGATVALWDMTRRLFGDWAAIAAAALFAALGPTQFLGAFATYDAMALCLMAAATWCAVASKDWDGTWYVLVSGGVLLALANATKYVTMLYDPSVIALGTLAAVQRRGAGAAFRRGRLMAVCLVLLDLTLLGLGRASYLKGLLFSTVARAHEDVPPGVVLSDAGRWIGVVCVGALFAVLVAAVYDRDHARTALVVVLAGTAALAPLGQARIGALTSLDKHVDFGGWFAAAAAGYTVAWVAGRGRRGWERAVAAAVALALLLVPAAVFGTSQSRTFFHWPDSSRFVAGMWPLIRHHPGRYLAEEDSVPAYYTQGQVGWQDWFDTWYLAYRPPGSGHTLYGAAAYRAAIGRHYFSLIALDFGTTSGMDHMIVADIRASGGYRVVAQLPYGGPDGPSAYTVWASETPSGHGTPTEVRGE